MTTSRRIPALLALFVLVCLALVSPLTAASGAPAPPSAPRTPLERILGPGSTREPGFSGYVTASGGALGVARLPDGRTGICLDTGPRAWPGRTGTGTYRSDPVVGYLTSRYLPVARHDAVTAAALWWAVGLDLHLNSAPSRMRGHVAQMRAESPAVYARVLRRHDQMLADARAHASAPGGYRTDHPLLGARTVTGLAVRAANGSAVPGVRATLHLQGGVFADGSHTWTGTVPGTVPGSAPAWHRTTGGAVHLAVHYTQVPASGFTLVRTGPSFQRVAVSAQLQSLDRQATLPALPRPTLHTTVSSTRAVVGSSLVDAVQVSGAGTAAVTGQWRLLGPVPATPSGCDGVDWTGAPDRASGTFAAHGDGTYPVGSTVLTVAGCYTYVERLLPSPATRATPWTAAGAATETSLLLARPQVSTAVSQQHAVAGGRLSDTVTVSDLPGGASSLLHWRLLGPVAPQGDTCRGVSWTQAPIRAQGQVPVRGDDAARVIRVGLTTVTRGGCYTYQERLDATALSVATDWTTAGMSVESTTVLPRTPDVPQHPQVDTGGSWSPSWRMRPRTASTAAVRIGSVGLSAAVSPVRFHAATLTPPSVTTAGWWADGAHLDALVGTTVIAGHVSDDHDRPAPFSHLRQARVGAIVTTTSARGTTTRWKVTSIASYDRRHLPRTLFAQHLARRLVLITCTDKVTYRDGGFHYRRNLVLTALPVHP